MKKKKTETIIDSIRTRMINKYEMIYGYLPKKTSIEALILEELSELKTVLTIQDALLFLNMFSYLDFGFASKEQKVWREFVFCHFVFLFRKKMISFDSKMLCFICDVIHEENINNDLYLKLLSDQKWVIQIFEHAIFVDFSSSLTKQYKIDQERIRKVFFFLCKKVEHALQTMPKEKELYVIKKQLLRMIKSYQSNQLFKRSVTM